LPTDDESVNTPFNTQTKNSEIFGAVIEDRIRLVSPTPAKNYEFCIPDPSTGNCIVTQIQRTFVLGINNDLDLDRDFKLVIANQPGEPVLIGQDGDDQILVDARASWRQLPYGPVFDPDPTTGDEKPIVIETLTVPGQSFDYITLFVVSQSTDNPVTVLAYDDTDTLVAQITVNGISDAGDLIDPGVGADVRVEEVHNPALIQPDWSALEASIETLNPLYPNPAYRNPAYRNPAYRNPAYRNEAFQDTSIILDPTKDDSEVVYDYVLREPTELLTAALRNPAYRNDAPTSFVDVTFGVEGDTNTITAFNADFAFVGTELEELDTQLIAWNSNEVDSLRNCGIAQISEDTVIAAVNNPAYRNLAIADIGNNLDGSIHFVTGVKEVTNLTIRIFGSVPELVNLVGVPAGCDPSTTDCIMLQKNLAWALGAQSANTIDCRPGVPIEQCQINNGEELIVRDLIPPAFEPLLEDDSTFFSEATGSDPDAAATIDLVTDEGITANDNGTPVGVFCSLTNTGPVPMPTEAPLGESTAQCDTDPDEQGNVGTWTGFVFVEDNEPPAINILTGSVEVALHGAELVVPPDNATGAIVNYLAPGAFNGGTISVSDNIFKLPPEPPHPYPTLSCVPDSGTEFALNTPPTPTQVTCTAIDAGPCNPDSNMSCVDDEDFPDGHNVTKAIFTVTVQDLEAPVINGVENGFLLDFPVAPANEASDIYTPVTLVPPTATDDIDDIPTVTSDAPDPAEFPLGTTIITWTAVDFTGNVGSTAQQRIIIVDTTDPIVTVSFPGGNSQVSNSAAGKSVMFDRDIDDIFPDASTLMCETAPDSPVVSGDIFPPGDTTVTCTGADTSGNLGVGSATVTIVLEFLPSGISGKSSGKAGSSFPLVWSWDLDGAPSSVAEQSLLITTEPGGCPVPAVSLEDVPSAEDPGSSGVRLQDDGSYQYNLQAVDPNTGDPLDAVRPSSSYCFQVSLPTGEFQQLELTVRP